MQRESQAAASLSALSTTPPPGDLLRFQVESSTHRRKGQAICVTPWLIYEGSFTFLSGPNGDEQRIPLFRFGVLSLAAVILQIFFPVINFQ